MKLSEILDKNRSRKISKIVLDYEGDIQEYENIQELEEEAYNWDVANEPAIYTVVKDVMHIKMRYEYMKEGGRR